MQILLHYTLQVIAVYVLVRMLHERLSAFSVIYTASVAIQLLTKNKSETHNTSIDTVIGVMLRSVVSILVVIVLHAITST